MATYAELYDKFNDTAIRNRVAVAAVIKAQTLIDAASPTANQVTWANNTLKKPLAMAEKLWAYVLGANNAATIAQINAATDATLQGNVNDAADALIAGGALDV